MRAKSEKPKRNIWKEYKEKPPYGTYSGPRGTPEEWQSAFADAWEARTAKKIVGQESAWQILEVEIGASLAEITKSFRRLMLKHHPDHGGDSETCRKIIAAYTVLKEQAGHR
jgi:DnaJ-domain-containing protein 1